jgi:hypothetical protein
LISEMQGNEGRHAAEADAKNIATVDKETEADAAGAGYVLK